MEAFQHEYSYKPRGLPSSMALVLHLDDEIPVLEAAGNQIG